MLWPPASPMSLHAFAGIIFCTWDMLPFKILLSLPARLKFCLTTQYFCSVSKKSVCKNSHIYFPLWPSRYTLFIRLCLECELLGGAFLGLFSCGLLLCCRCCTGLTPVGTVTTLFWDSWESVFRVSLNSFSEFK